MKKLSFLKCFVETLPIASESLVKTLRATSLLGMMVLAPMGATAQVTIGSDALPQATLDIIGDTLTTHGEAFRLIDGNQVPGKVLTCDENGIGSWQKNGITIQFSALDRTRTSPTFKFSDYPLTNHPIYVDYGCYIDLEPGRYLMFFSLPIFFNFPLDVFESVTYQLGLTKDGSTVLGGHTTQVINGPLRANVMTRNITYQIINTSGDSATTRYYVCYFDFVHKNATNGTVNQTGTVSLLGNNTGGNFLAIPLVQ